MTPQTFAYSDIGKIGFLVVLEALLSADNALILAIMVRHLPRDQQKKALMYGLLGAVALRIAAIALASQIISFWWLQAVGALYLLYLPISHFWRQSHKEAKGKEGASFWMTVLYADLADLAFAIDSVLVAVAIVPNKDKLWVIISGAVVGILLLRWAATVFLRILERYPVFDDVAFLLVGWAGAKLLTLSWHNMEEWLVKAHPDFHLAVHVPKMPDWLFWVGMALIVVGGTVAALRKGPVEPEQASGEEPESVNAAQE